MFPVRASDRIAILLASSLLPSNSYSAGMVDDGTYQPNTGVPSLADGYDYVMHGRVFSVKHIENLRVEVQASFGGLLLRLRGEQAHLEAFVVDMT